MPDTAKHSGFVFEWGGTETLTIEEIWPNGDAPENPTRDDVISVMQEYRSLYHLCSEWNLDVQGIEVDGKDCGLR